MATKRKDGSPMRRKRIFLHAGFHKTGTTSIQVALLKSRDKLAAVGVSYPSTETRCWGLMTGHHHLPWSIVRRAGFMSNFGSLSGGFDDAIRDALWLDLYKEIDSTSIPTVILSSEEFDILDRAEIETLGHRLAAYDVTPVICLRSHSDLVESMFRTTVLDQPYDWPIERFSEMNRHRLDFLQMLHDWRSIACRGDIIVLSYEDEEVRRDAVRAFLAAIDLDPKLLGDTSVARQNESLPAFVCEIVRFLRSRGVEEQKVRIWIDHARKIGFPAAANIRYSCMPAELRVRLDQRYTQEVSAILADPSLSRLVRGRLLSASKTCEPIVIEDPLQAVAQFVGEMPLGFQSC